MRTIPLLAVALLTLTACDNLSRSQQRALSGGALGAAGGAGVAALTGGSAVTGALIGGAAGAVVGAVTTPSRGYPRRHRGRDWDD